MVTQLLDLVARQVEHGPQILERGEAIDALACSEDSASQLAVEAGQRRDDLSRRVVDIDQAAVVGTRKVRPSDARLERQLRVLNGKRERLLALCEALTRALKPRVSTMHELSKVLVQPAHYLSPGPLVGGDVVLDAAARLRKRKPQRRHRRDRERYTVSFVC
jgi:hypothetical protein